MLYLFLLFYSSEYNRVYTNSQHTLTWNIHVTTIHRPSVAVMWLIHFGNIRPFICPWVVALHSSFEMGRKKKEDRIRRKWVKTQLKEDKQQQMRPWRVSVWDLKLRFKYSTHPTACQPLLRPLTVQEIGRILYPNVPEDTLARNLTYPRTGAVGFTSDNHRRAISCLLRPHNKQQGCINKIILCLK